MARDRQLIRLSDAPHEPTEWFWENRLPKKAVTFLDGDPGHGTSTIAYDLTARVTTGRPMPAQSGAVLDGGVVILQGEDSCSIVKDRVAAAGGDVGRVAVYDPRLFAGQPLTLPSDLDVVEDAVVEVSARLLVIDPMTCFMVDSIGNEQKIRASLDRLTALAQRRDLAVLIRRHLTKSGGANPLYRGVGSIGAIAAVRAAFAVASDPQSTDMFQHVLVQTKGSLAIAPTLRYRTVQVGDARKIEWLGVSDCRAEDALRSSVLDMSALSEAVNVLFSLLQDGPLAASEVRRRARALGISERTLARAKRVLEVRSNKHGSGGGSHWTWELNPTHSLVEALKAKELDELSDHLFYGDDAVDCQGRIARSKQVEAEDGDDGTVV